MRESTGAASTPALVKSAERALRLLEMLAANESSTFAQLSRDLELPKSSLHALLATMSAMGWVSTTHTGGFALGYRARAMGVVGLENGDVVGLFSEPMSKLRDGIGETIHLARLDGTDVLYLATRFSHHALNVRFEIGRRLPAYSTALGKAMLSELPRGELPDHVPSTFTAFTPKTIRSKSELFAALVDVRRQGYAEDDEEGSLGLYCLAVALSHPDLPLSAVSCSIPKVRIADHDLKGITMALLEAKRHVLARLRPLPMLGADR